MNKLIRNKKILDLFKYSIYNNSNSLNIVKNLSSASENLNQIQKPQSSIKSNKNELEAIETVTKHVNEIAQDPRRSRLFAVVMIAGSQYKVTNDDVIVVRNHFYPTIGDKIRLEKVLLVGSKDFTVVGKPLVSKEFVRVEATVIEKTLSNNVMIFTYKPRKDNRRMNFYKSILTLLRINLIEILGPVPNTQIKQPNQIP